MRPASTSTRWKAVGPSPGATPVQSDVYGFIRSPVAERGSSDGIAVDIDCWGANDLGQLTGDGGNSDTPTKLKSLMPGGLIPERLAAGSNHTCVLLPNGTVACWGANDKGQLGIGSTASSVPLPTLVNLK